MFSGFTERYVAGDGARLFLRQGGDPARPVLILLHGYPQTSAMWHRLAPLFCDDFHVLCPDLRGYGRSDKPPSDPDHQTYSKRQMARDLVRMLDEMDCAEAYVIAHDRGGRVAHRMALDHPDRIRALTLLDIAPTREMYRDAGSRFATAYWHWYFLIQPHPLPETLIGHDPEAYWRLKCITQAGGQSPFAPEALAEYLSTFADPACIQATCEDYRAAASIDIAHDDADQGHPLTQPLQVLWARRGVIETCFDPMALWQERAVHVTGQALDATHYMAEEIPEEIAALVRRFLAQHPI